MPTEAQSETITRATPTTSWWRRHTRLRGPIGVVLGLVTLVGGWYAASLWGLPDVGDPFDTHAFGTVVVLDGRNAFDAYEAASIGLTPMPKAWVEHEAKQAKGVGWAAVPEELRRWLDRNREPLATWRQGTGLAEAVYHQPRKLRVDTPLNVAQDLRAFSHLARLEAMRLEAEGDHAGAWGWHRAALRSSRHVMMHAPLIARLIGGTIHHRTTDDALRWAENPKVDARLLRQALDDALAIDTMTPPVSETLKVEYLMLMNSMDDPRWLVAELPGHGHHEWYQHNDVYKQVRVHGSNDVERSRRVIRLLFANWLPQADRAKADRAPVVSELPLVYAADPTVPPSARRLSPETLARRFRATALAPLAVEPYHKLHDHLSRDRDSRARLIVGLAEQLYLRERGSAPKSAEELVGMYLKSLPEGHADVFLPSPRRGRGAGGEGEVPKQHGPSTPGGSSSPSP